MIYMVLVLALIAMGVVFLFTIKKSVLALILAIIMIIVGYFFAVGMIAKEAEDEASAPEGS
ncbi:MAG: hypothetical protein C6H99_05250 [Epsilonproteobacteria bacterium]|nr:hypothetical protein [Campylobacterota bacterium]NPA63996.1 hypothetical protein [Campylobacterota bacterium]